jgi:hypothetical protein
MSRNKIIAGCIGSFIGYIVFILLVDVISKPNNVSVAFRPIESLETYFFGFAFTMGNIGWLLGGLLLIGFIAVFYFIGTWVYKVVFKN